MAQTVPPTPGNHPALTDRSEQRSDEEWYYEEYHDTGFPLPPFESVLLDKEKNRFQYDYNYLATHLEALQFFINLGIFIPKYEFLLYAIHLNRMDTYEYLSGLDRDRICICGWNLYRCQGCRKEGLVYPNDEAILPTPTGKESNDPTQQVGPFHYQMMTNFIGTNDPCCLAAGKCDVTFYRLVTFNFPETVSSLLGAMFNKNMKMVYYLIAHKLGVWMTDGGREHINTHYLRAALECPDQGIAKTILQLLSKQKRNQQQKQGQTQNQNQITEKQMVPLFDPYPVTIPTLFWYTKVLCKKWSVLAYLSGNMEMYRYADTELSWFDPYVGFFISCLRQGSDFILDYIDEFAIDTDRCNEIIRDWYINKRVYYAVPNLDRDIRVSPYDPITGIILSRRHNPVDVMRRKVRLLLELGIMFTEEVVNATYDPVTMVDSPERLQLVCNQCAAYPNQYLRPKCRSKEMDQEVQAFLQHADKVGAETKPIRELLYTRVVVKTGSEFDHPIKIENNNRSGGVATTGPTDQPSTRKCLSSRSCIVS